MEQAREYWGRVDRPNLMIKIPGTDEGLPAIEQMIYEGLNINVTLLFRVEQYEKVAEAYIRGPRAPPRGGQVARRALGRVVLRLARRHRGRQAPGGARRATTSCSGKAGARQRARRLPALQGDLPRRALRRRCAPPARRCSARCGRRPASRTRSTRTRCTSTGCRARDRQHDADGDAAGRGRARARSPARPPTQDPSAGPAGARRRRHRHDDVTDKLLRDGVDAFVTPMEKLLAGIESKREAIVTGPPGDDRGVAARRARAGRSARAAQAADRGRRRARGSGARTTRSGAPARRARGRQPARLADDRRAACARRSTTSRRSPSRPSPTASPTSCCSGMGGSSLAPEVLRRSFGDAARRAAPARARLDRRRGGPRRRGRDRRRHGRCSWSRSSPAGRSSRCRMFEHFWARRPRRRALRRDHRPGLGAGRARRTSTASAACSPTTPTSAGATARCRTSGSCRRR